MKSQIYTGLQFGLFAWVGADGYNRGLGLVKTFFLGQPGGGIIWIGRRRKKVIVGAVVKSGS